MPWWVCLPVACVTLPAGMFLGMRPMWWLMDKLADRMQG